MRHPRPRTLAAIASVILAGGAPAAAADPPPSEPEVKVTSPGRPPLRPLRYRVQAGQRGSVTVGMKMTMAMSAGGHAQPATPTPELRYTLNYRVTGFTPEGDIRYEFDFADFEAVAAPGIPAAAVEAARTGLSGLQGLRGRAVVSTRGITREADIEVPASAPPQVRAMTESMRQSIRQFSAPLPEEPVGPGARWDTTHRLSMNGITFLQTGRHELTSLDGERGKLAIALTQTAPPQRMENPSLPPGARVDLVSVESSGDGANEFDLTRLVPTSARMKLAMKMKTRIKIGEMDPQDMDTTVDMSMTLAGRTGK
jgi:hypothetical protein